MLEYFNDVKDEAWATIKRYGWENGISVSQYPVWSRLTKSFAMPVATAYEVTTLLGIDLIIYSYTPHTEAGSFFYDSKMMRLAAQDGCVSEGVLYHELGHYASGERSLWDKLFGYTKEERVANLFQALVMEHLGRPFNKAHLALYDHAWLVQGHTNEEEITREAYDRVSMMITMLEAA